MKRVKGWRKITRTSLVVFTIILSVILLRLTWLVVSAPSKALLQMAELPEETLKNVSGFLVAGTLVSIFNAWVLIKMLSITLKPLSKLWVKLWRKT